MRKAVILLVVLLIFAVVTISQSNQTPKLAEVAKTETIKGDVVELQGKSTFYKDKYGDYPIFVENIYTNTDGVVAESIIALERLYDKNYIEENIKLINTKEMKGKGVTSELANKKKAYFLDTKTGQVISPDLINEGDDEYISELVDNIDNGYRIIETIKIQNESGEMNPVNGSYKKGAYMYFYGGGDIKFARRNESNNEIVDLTPELNVSNLKEVLYVQTETGKGVFKLIDNTIVVNRIEGD